MKRALVVGSGAGGATAAKELQGDFEVTVVEAGGEFSPLRMKLSTIERMKHFGVLRDPRMIQWLMPNMRIRRTADGMVLVNGVGLGGTTTLATGNGVRVDGDLQALGIDLDAEFESAQHEIPISAAHEQRWGDATRGLFDVCGTMGLEPRTLPKMGDAERCVGCGRCVLGCRPGAKWDSRRFLHVAVEHGARVVEHCEVERLVVEGRRATGVVARRGLRREFMPADLVVLAAGGFGTPPILHASGIACEPRLFVDPVLCVATEWPEAGLCHQIAMPFVVQRDGFIIAPYFDLLSFAFNGQWRFPARDTLALMIKLADNEVGSICGDRIDKCLTTRDHERLAEGVRLCTSILDHFGVPERALVLGTLNAGHPGGMLPLTRASAATFHDERLPDNVYIADASLFPRSLGNPPILTIVAMAKRVAAICRRQWGGS
jgi:choline dehydrogenase-like flavoprotein